MDKKTNVDFLVGKLFLHYSTELIPYSYERVREVVEATYDAIAAMVNEGKREADGFAWDVMKNAKIFLWYQSTQKGINHGK